MKTKPQSPQTPDPAGQEIEGIVFNDSMPGLPAPDEKLPGGWKCYDDFYAWVACDRAGARRWSGLDRCLAAGVEVDLSPQALADLALFRWFCKLGTTLKDAERKGDEAFELLLSNSTNESLTAIEELSKMADEMDGLLLNAPELDRDKVQSEAALLHLKVCRYREMLEGMTER
jgi:hypothetical protein